MYVLVILVLSSLPRQNLAYHVMLPM